MSIITSNTELKEGDMIFNKKYGFCRVIENNNFNVVYTDNYIPKLKDKDKHSSVWNGSEYDPPIFLIRSK